MKTAIITGPRHVFFRSVHASLIVIFLCCFVMPINLVQAQVADVIAGERNQDGEISVSADAWAWSAPDSARISIGIASASVKALEIEQQLRAKEKAITSAVLNIDPKARVLDRGDSFANHAASSSIANTEAIRITRYLGFEISDPSLAPAVVDAARTAGADVVTDVEYLVRNAEAVKSQAITAATTKAREKAEAIAATLKTKLGSLIQADVTEEPAAQMMLRQKQQGGNFAANYQDQEFHLFVTLRFRSIELTPAS